MRTLKLWLPVILWSALLLFAATDVLSSESTGGLFRRLFGFELPDLVHSALRKIGHLVAYAILAGLTWRADRRWPVIMVIALVVASCDETIQSFSSKRGGTPWDVLIDLTGAGALTIFLQRSRHFRDQSARADAH